MTRLPKTFALVMAAALVLGACAVPQPATPATGESPVPASAEAPSQPSVLRVGWSAEPDTLNPFTTYSTEAGEILQLVYDKLLGYGLDMKVQPELAASF